MEAVTIPRLNFQDWIKSAQDYDPGAFARLKADGYNRTPGKLTEYDCPKCLNRGNFAVPRDDGSCGYAPCSCQSIRSCIRHMENSGLSKEVLKKCTFGKFIAEQPWQAEAKAKAQAYAANPAGWFLACGQSGSGKSHLCTAICTKLMMGGQALHYISWRNVIGRLKSFEEGQALMDKYIAVDNLYIDDLFKMGAGPEGQIKPSNADISIAFQLIDSRSRGGLRTILSTERMPEELAAIDEATAGRILEQTGTENLLCIARDTGKNHRLRGMLSS